MVTFTRGHCHFLLSSSSEVEIFPLTFHFFDQVQIEQRDNGALYQNHQATVRARQNLLGQEILDHHMAWCEYAQQKATLSSSEQYMESRNLSLLY